MRCASSIRPSASNAPTCCSSSCADLVDRAVDGRLRGDVLASRARSRGCRAATAPRPVSGSKCEICSTSSPNSETRYAVSLFAGCTSIDVAAHAEPAATEHRVVPDVLRVDQRAEHLVAVVLRADLEDEHRLAPLLGRAEPVDARHARDHDHVPARQERARRAEPQARDVVVLRRVLLDVEVGLRDVRLGLVVVVVGDEVLDRVLREELAELVAELRGERLVVRDHERRALELLHHPGHRRRLARARRAEQRLPAVARAERLRELRDRARLVAGRAIGGVTRRSGISGERSNGRTPVPRRAPITVCAPLARGGGSVWSPSDGAGHGDQTSSVAPAGYRVRDAHPRGLPATGEAAPQSTPKPNRRPVPILMYHVIGDPPAVGAVSRPVRLAGRARGAGSLARARGIRGRDARARLRRLARPGDAARSARSSSRSTTDTEATSRQRFRSSPRDGWPGVLNLDLSNLAPSWGIRRVGVRAPDRGGMGNRRAFAHPRRPLGAERRSAHARGGRLAAGDPSPVRRRAALLLLPRGPLRRRGDRCCPGGRLRGRDHDRARARLTSRGPIHARAGTDRPRRRRRWLARKLASLGLPVSAGTGTARPR